MILNHRASILHRPVRQEPSQVFQENEERDHLREQERWRGKSERLAEAEERLRRSCYPGPEDALLRRQEAQEAAAHSEAARAQELQRQAAAEAAWASRPRAAAAGLADAQRPWTVPSLQLDEQALELARRRLEAATLQQNQAAAAGALESQRSAAETSRRLEAQAAQDEGCFWSRGAASEAWIAPTFRAKAPHPHALREAWRASPILPDADAAQQPAPWAAAAAPKTYPWSWDAEPK